MRSKLLFMLSMLFSSGLFAQGEFVTIWQTPAGPGLTGISFNIGTNGAANYTWETVPAGVSGSGTFNTFSGSASVSGLPSGATIRLIIEPTNLRKFFLNGGADAVRLLELEQWGTTVWSSMANMFYGCSNMMVSASDIPDLSNSNNPGMTLDLGNLFRGCSSITSVPNIENWNTANVGSMHATFFGASQFNQDIGNWNTQNVTVSSYMFREAYQFNQDIGDWDMADVIDMSYMFHYSSSFNQDIGSWNTSSAINMAYMFCGATVFNQDISAWNTANVDNMWNMFSNMTAFNQNLNNWNTSNVTSMAEMFRQNTSFNGAIGNWNTANVSSIQGMFNGASSFNQPIGNWNTGNVTNLSQMFMNATSFNQPIGSWNTQYVENMADLFNGASVFNQALNNWNTSQVTNMSGMFSQAPAFDQDISSWNTGLVAYMNSMFNAATSFNRNISSWNVENVGSMNAMFTDAAAFDQNLGNWHIDNLSSAQGMFAGSGLSCGNYSAALTGWNAYVNTHPMVDFSAQTGMMYNSAALTARDNLINGKAWIINGDASGGANCTLSVNETKKSTQLTVFPNPTSGIIFIQSEEAADIRITDIKGTLMLQKEISHSGTINLSAFAPGIYLVHTPDGTTLKIIKE